MKLVSYANAWHRIWSVRLVILTLLYKGAIEAWNHLPMGWQPALKPWEQWLSYAVGVALTAATGMAAVIHQPSLKQDDAKSSD
jgi:hypothetical protein